MRWPTLQATNLCDRVCSLAEVGASAHVGLGQKVLDQPHANAVAHLFQLLVDLLVVTIVVLAQLGNNSAIGQGHEFGINLVHLRPTALLLMSADIRGEGMR